MYNNEKIDQVQDALCVLAADDQALQGWFIHCPALTWNPANSRERECEVNLYQVKPVGGKVLLELLDYSRKFSVKINLTTHDKLPESYAKSDGAPITIAELIESKRLHEERLANKQPEIEIYYWHSQPKDVIYSHREKLLYSVETRNKLIDYFLDKGLLVMLRPMNKETKTYTLAVSEGSFGQR